MGGIMLLPLGSCNSFAISLRFDNPRPTLERVLPMENFRRSFLLLTLALVLSAPLHSSAKSLKVVVAEPVLEELMGGCSLACSVAWQVEVLNPAGGKSQMTRLLNDESAQSSWSAPQGSTGVGTRFRILFPKKLPAQMEGQIPLYGIDLVNGQWKAEEDFKAFGRLRKARLFHNDKPIGDLSFPDSRRWLKAEFPDLMLQSGDTLTLEVLEIYPGSKAGLHLSELVLQGAH
jgi:hypothetical protein